MPDDTPLTAADVLELTDRLTAAGVSLWLDGGWGLDALLGRQTREHSDLDVVAPRDQLDRIAEALAPLGFAHHAAAWPGLPSRLVLRDARGRQLDVHPVVWAESGDVGLQELPDGSWCRYPASELGATGTVGGRPVPCIGAELQLAHHQGYEPTAVDRADVQALARHAGLALPPAYAGSEGGAG